MESFSNYVNYKMPEGTLINDYIDQMNIRLRNLFALGRDMDQELQRLYLLQSLPPSWENVFQTLSLQKTLIVKDIEAELIAEGLRQAARGVVPTALLAQTCEIKSTLKLQLCYQGDDLKLRGYSDADWAGDLDKRKLATGYVYTLGGGAVSWGSKKQTSTAMSTAEAEYIACSTAVQEVVWLRNFLRGIDLIGDDQPVPMNIVTEPKFNSRSKHAEIKYHFIREKAENGEIEISYLPSKDLMTDALTKPLPTEEFARHVMCMELKYI
eukprot:TRINITY_DN17093_c1_g1_i3.p1 TRINITY_DN17093_c1_g1~~TRINITY_DN17093_c1_g1_i3.p1  ORF type:complete len:267 (-),score=36.41 TRINITY_DN17093_c1_g1_i3:293-1093(-)